MNKSIIFFHYVSVTLFPASGNAFIHFRKDGATILSTDAMYTITTDRKVSFEYALRYIIRHHMKMEQNTEFKDMFKAVKG